MYLTNSCSRNPSCSPVPGLHLAKDTLLLSWPWGDSSSSVGLSLSPSEGLFSWRKGLLVIWGMSVDASPGNCTRPCRFLLLEWFCQSPEEESVLKPGLSRRREDKGSPSDVSLVAAGCGWVWEREWGADLAISPLATPPPPCPADCGFLGREGRRKWGGRWMVDFLIKRDWTAPSYPLGQ